MNIIAEKIKNETPDVCAIIVREFNEKNESAKDFPELNLDQKKCLWDAITFRVQQPETSEDLRTLLLGSLRILSRDKASLDEVVNESLVTVLLKLAGLTEEDPEVTPGTIESIKVIYNFIYQSSKQQSVLVENGLLEGVMNAIRNFKTSKLSPECQHFLLRVLFLITALRPATGQRIQNDLNGGSHIINLLEEFAASEEPYDDITLDVITEAMKVLYNIFQDTTNGETSKDSLLKISELVKLFLRRTPADGTRQHELQSHAIDLLNTVTTDCFEELAPVTSHSTFEFENHDMTWIEIMVNFLQFRLCTMESSRASTNTISPVLAVLYRMATSNRLIRKYLKKRILPPLTKTDISERPEVGNTLRNKLCALLTSPTGTELVANLLFILCKENVNRMVKYTGYGNAAGLLANRGLMLGGRCTTNDYSSSSDESDTEEYKEVRHLINDVEGWLQPERPPPCEGMTDEQKEYEAMKLVQAIDRLQRNNLIQPCTISENGKPQPIQHVLQLQNAVTPAFNSHDSDSD